MINEVCHTAGAALNPARRVAFTLRLQEGGLMWSKWKAYGRNGRRRSDATPLNKVTSEKRKEQRQPGRRYEEERSDSLKRYKGMFDFPLPGAISAAEQSQWWQVKVSPDNDQWFSVCMHGEAGRDGGETSAERREVVALRPEERGFSAEHPCVFKICR